MTNITVENIIAHAEIADELDIHKIAEKIPSFMYNPTEFLGLTLKLNEPNVAVLLLPNGRLICTGAKKFEDVEYSINEVTNKIKNIDVKIKNKTNIEIQNIIVSTDLGKELDLNTLAKSLLFENISYEPDKFPGLVYQIEDMGAILLVFSSGKIVCTGTKNLENASKTIEIIKEKILSLEVQ